MGTQSNTFVSLTSAAYRLGVPAAWLRAEARAGRIPHLKAGRRILFNVSLVEKVLLRRTADREVVTQ
jgi:hypothetical protein